jgi:hypothetical protein
LETNQKSESKRYEDEKYDLPIHDEWSRGAILYEEKPCLNDESAEY